MTALYVTLSKFLQGQQGRSQNCLIMHSLKEHLYHRYFLLSLVIFNCNLWIKSEHLVSKHLFLILYFNRIILKRILYKHQWDEKEAMLSWKAGCFFALFYVSYQQQNLRKVFFVYPSEEQYYTYDVNFTKIFLLTHWGFCSVCSEVKDTAIDTSIFSCINN